MKRVRSIPVVAVGLSFMGCTPGLDGVWEVSRVTDAGQDVTDDYTYSYSYDGCRYTYSLRLMFFERQAVAFTYSAYQCGRESYVGGYGTYFDVVGRPRRFELTYGGEDGAFLTCQRRRNIVCDDPDGEMQFTFRRLGGTWE